MGNQRAAGIPGEGPDAGPDVFFCCLVGTERLGRREGQVTGGDGHQVQIGLAGVGSRPAAFGLEAKANVLRLWNRTETAN